MTYDVAIIILAYNSERQLGECLRSVLDLRRAVTQQVIVLDNASPDRSGDLVEENFPEVTLIRSKKNLGFAAGVNLAARQADAEFILLLNPDTVLLNQAVDAVVQFARARPGHGLYGGRTFKPDGSLEPSSCWGLPTLWSLATFACGLSTLFVRNPFFDPESLGRWPRDTVREVGIITGCFLLISREVWEQLGGFDPRYFMYGEDIDLAMRAHAAGFRPLICPDAHLIHEVGQSSKVPAHKAMLLYRGKATLIHAHWRGLRRWLGLCLLLGGVAIRAMAAWLQLPTKGRQETDRWLVLWRQRDTWRHGYPENPAHRP